jgi:hypothetical protein
MVHVYGLQLNKARTKEGMSVIMWLSKASSAYISNLNGGYGQRDDKGNAIKGKDGAAGTCAAGLRGAGARMWTEEVGATLGGTRN